MTPEHRQIVLEEIRQRLKDGLPCRVVSTSLLEAGVDVDFPRVYREEAGLTSILQAAGRCNRGGEQERYPKPGMGLSGRNRAAAAYRPADSPVSRNSFGLCGLELTRSGAGLYAVAF